MSSFEPSQSTRGKKCELHLIVHHRTPFNGHWSLFVPTQHDGNIGARYEAVGDVRNGFEHEVTREWNMKEDSRTKSVLLLGEVSIVGEGSAEALDGANATENEGVVEARDTFEAVVLGVPAPGPGMRSSGESGTDAVSLIGQTDESKRPLRGSRAGNCLMGANQSQNMPKTKLKMKDCQDWIRDVVDALIEKEMLDEEAKGTVKTAPVH